ncbi:hypothetical protein PT015_06875 [Candidatus Mycobacterium wuenschmannii]|uniref:Transmembrane protein n=1 Tax=Candidatus Mycobacterium wuenschmannii TaxID=3027808 RepID=A0ABY8W1D6_9MYCO|nr:hypothetical protein [Candidatus Mycobacterium wuenschmannii]WIM89171.1 hypothetical protein PT015_06875 [Candidatus Mycobacterium wuenschmannii]
MLIVSLVLAVIGLAALVFAVITSNELVAWVCIGASVLGVVLLIVDALQERQRRGGPARQDADPAAGAHDGDVADYPADSIEDSEDVGAQSDSEGSVSDDHNTR